LGDLGVTVRGLPEGLIPINDLDRRGGASISLPPTPPTSTSTSPAAAGRQALVSAASRGALPTLAPAPLDLAQYGDRYSKFNNSKRDKAAGVVGKEKGEKGKGKKGEKEEMVEVDGGENALCICQRCFRLQQYGQVGRIT
jgi:hypothetical protein